MINILSIDWDYFVNATNMERRRMFPDGGNENLAPFLKSVIWSGLYASNKELEEIPVLDDIAEISEIINRNASINVTAMIVDSHKHIYDFIKENVSTDKRINLVNIDFHHDLYNVDEEKIHAGNWLTYLMKEYPKTSSYTWIARKDSEMDDVINEKNLKILYEDFKGLWNQDWDLIYICRSSMWSPPHLDEAFTETFLWITDDFHTKMETGIFNDRYNEAFQESIAIDREMREKLMNMGGTNIE